MVADPSGVAAVWLRYDTGSGAVTVAMMPDGPDGYTATVGPFGDGEVTANRPIELVVTATDEQEPFDARQFHRADPAQLRDRMTP